MFVAACIGFAGIKVFFQGPLAPAVALVGPIAPISPGDLLNATKEFYRGWREDHPHLDHMAESSTREAGGVLIELEPFVMLAYETFVEQLIVSRRPDSQRSKIEQLRKRMETKTPFSREEIERRIWKGVELPSELNRLFHQSVWNIMFMIGNFPENEERFGVNWSEIIDIVKSQVS